MNWNNILPTVKLFFTTHKTWIVILITSFTFGRIGLVLLSDRAKTWEGIKECALAIAWAAFLLNIFDISEYIVKIFS